jgi:hypothetical protein
MTNLNIRPYKQEDALEILTDPKERSWAKLNEVSGPGVTYEYEGEIAAVSGIRTYGIGEIWASFTDKAKKFKHTLLRESKRQLLKWMAQKDLWLVIATVDEGITDKQERFLKALGFTKTVTWTYRKG